MDELNRLLGDLRAEGSHDSEGAFTLSLDSALHKLSAHRMPPGAYLLKMVQAACRWGSQQVEIRLSGTRARVVMETPWVVDRDLLERAVASPLGSSPHPGLEHLLVGLMAASEMCEKPTCWLWDDSVTACLVLESNRLLVGYQKPPERPRFPAGCIVDLPRRNRNLWLDLKYALDATAEHHLVSENCRFAPLGVRLDGRCLNTPCLSYFWNRPGESSIRLVERDLMPGRELGCDLVAVEQPYDRMARHIELSGERYDVHRTQPFSYTQLLQLDYRPAEVPRTTRGSHGPRIGESGGQEYSAEIPLFGFPIQRLNGHSSWATGIRASLAVPLVLLGPGRLFFVKDGVLLPPRELDLGCPGALALVSASGLDTDLSQLSVVENAAYEALMSEIRSHIGQMVAAVPGEVSTMLRAGWDYSLKKRVLERLPRSS